MPPDIVLGHTSLSWWCGRELSDLCYIRVWWRPRGYHDCGSNRIHFNVPGIKIVSSHAAADHQRQHFLGSKQNLRGAESFLFFKIRHQCEFDWLLSIVG